MNYYPELIKLAFDDIVGAGNAKIVSLIHDSEPMDGREKGIKTGRIELPANFMISDSSIVRLAGSEQFVDDALVAIGQSDSNCVFAFPPLLGRMKLSDSFRSRFGQLTVVEAFAQALIESGRVQALAMLVPTSFLGNSSCGSWRRDFFPSQSALVVEHAHETNQQLSLPTSISLSLSTVVFKGSVGPVRFFKIDNLALASGKQKLLSDLQRLLRQPAGKSQFGYVCQQPLSDRYPTTFDFYSEETQKLRQEVSNLGERVSLERIASVLAGFRPCRPDCIEDNAVNGFWKINPTDISTDGNVDITGASIHERPAVVSNYLQDGDYCIRQIYSADSGFVVGEYRGDGRRITWGPNIIVVRPKPELSYAQRQVLLSFLRSGIAQKLSNAKQTMSMLGGHLRISPSVLRDFPVPIADVEIVSAIEHLAAARAAFQEWIAEIDDASNAIVRESTTSGSRNVILASGQLARQRFRAATQVKELDYRIRTQYPHPLAYVWREVQVSGPDLYHRLRSIIKAAEAHTCVMAQLAIVLGRTSERSIAYLTSIADRLATRGGGTNFGDWFSVVKEVTESRVFRTIAPGTPLGELRRLADNTGWEEAIRRLMDLRNDDSHQRINPSCVPVTLVKEAEHLLEKVFQATEFLTDYQLIQITETKFNSIRRINLSCLSRKWNPR